MSSFEGKPIINVQYILYGHETALADLEDKLKTDVTNGLSQKDADERLLLFGKNEITTPKPSIWKLYLAPLFDVLIVTYLVMTGFMLALGIFVPGVISKISIWIFMISLNVVMVLYQSIKAQKKIEALMKLSPPRAKIIRDGMSSEILAENLVPGDIIELAIGDKIPADSRIIRSSNLTVNEASLTGESHPVEKLSDGNELIEVGTPISQHSNFLYLGTYIQTGIATALVVRTGNDTEIGKIASAIHSNISNLDIPLRSKINSLGKYLALIMVIFLVFRIAFTSYLQIIEKGFIDIDQFLFELVDSIIVAMSAVPVNIPLLVTVILISGVLKMASNRVIVKNLATVETLGRCSVLASDKTGTLTTSKMSVKLIWDTAMYFGTTFRDIEYTLTPIDEEDIVNFMQNETLKHPPMINIRSGSPLELVLSTAVLNNGAILQFNSSSTPDYTDYEIIGNPTDGALLLLSISQGFEEDNIKERYKKYRDYPFDSKLKRMSGIFQDTKEGDYMVLSKGATEVILPRCTQIGDEQNSKPLTDELRQDISTRVNYFASNGYRVISLAYRAIDELPDADNHHKEREQLEQNLTYIGFATIYDPPRPGAREAVKELDSAGIFPIMITGDSLNTAATIARQVGILDKDEIVVEGRLASVLSDDEFFKVSVFARVSPQDKETIVSRYQRRGDIVAMTGDGINDSLAVSKSDAGIAMGLTGTDVTKEAADLIITDDSYVSLVNGVNEGRNLFEKIRIMIFFYLAVNLAESTLYVISSFIPGFYLITLVQRVYIFSIVHAFPVLAIIFGPQDKEIMKLKPRSNAAIIPKPLIKAMLVFSLSYLITLFSVYGLYYFEIFSLNSTNLTGFIDHILINDPSDPLTATSIAHAKARTMLISVMYLTESFIVLSIRRMNSTFWNGLKDMNLFTWTMVLIGPAINFLVLFFPTVQITLLDRGLSMDFVDLTTLDFFAVIFYAMIPLVLLELFKWNRRKNDIQM